MGGGSPRPGLARDPDRGRPCACHGFIMRSRLVFNLTLLILITLLNAACRLATPTPSATSVAPPTATPHPDAIVWVVPGPPTTLDASRLLDDPVGEQIGAQVYDRLVRLRPGTTQLAPGIAAQWDADTRAHTFTFTLREGLTFHDGTPLDADAVVWNFQRWMDPKHPFHHGKFQVWQGLFGGFIGQQDEQGREAWLVESAEVLGPRQVRFKLRASFTPFLHHLAMVPFGLASPTAVKSQGERYGGDREHWPVGSGPFKVVGWDADGTVRLAPFADYWAGAPAGAGLAFVPVPDDQARIAAVTGGAAHGAELAATTPITAALEIPSVKVVPRPARETTWLMLNLGRPPLDDLRVRQAISLAIDRARLAREHFGSLSLPASQLLPPEFLGHNPEVPAPEFDPDEARRLLAEADAAGNFPLNIWVPDQARPYLPDPAGSAQAVAEMLKAIGINAAVRTTGARQFLKDRGNSRFTAWITGWQAQSPDPDNFWFWHFGTPARAVAEGNYSNADLAGSLRDAQRTLDSEQRADIYRTAARTVDRDVARIFLVHPRPVIVVSARLRDYQPSPLGFDDFTQVTLAPAPPGATAAPLPTIVTPAAAPGTAGTPDALAGSETPQAPASGTPATPAGAQGTEGASATGTPADAG